jgi:hypothetical protein
VSALIGAAAAAGAISSQAASALDNGLATVVSSLEAGNSTDAAAKLSTLTQTATTLESQGQISPAAAMPLNAALGAVGSALGLTAPSASGGGPAGGVAGGPAAGPAAGPAGKGGRFGNPGAGHGRGPFGRGGSFRP